YNVDHDNILVIYWKAEITEGERDDFGRPSTKYFIDELNFELTVADSPVATLSAKTSAGNVASALSGYKIYVDGLNEKNINNSTKYTSSSLYVEYYYENGNSGSNSDHGDFRDTLI
ncbi:MAG: hypothetical protein LUC40_01395, partial [Oscillospiraceae bacterium]|nr:hypothetical protein [Oscillospiraceae bacterium]